MLVTIIGAGVTGLAVARELAPYHDVFIYEKGRVAEAQSGHNSGVNHPGIIHDQELEPLKSFHCVRGNAMNWEYLRSKKGTPHEIAYRHGGELIVARTDAELKGLLLLEEKAGAKGIVAYRLGPHQTCLREPGINAFGGLWVPSSGVFDSAAFARALLHDAERAGAHLFVRTPVEAVEPVKDGFRVVAGGEDFIADALINAAGLYADGFARQCGVEAPAICPYRGEYYAIHPSAGVVQNLIYFPPDGDGLGHGMHFMRDTAGRAVYGPSIECDLSPGAREDYAPRELIGVNGSRRPTLDHFLENARKAFPGLERKHLAPDMVGIRAKTRPPGSAIPSDFFISRQLNGAARAYHIIADSPGLTSCLSIARSVAEGLGIQADAQSSM